MAAKDSDGKRLSGPMQQRAKRIRELGEPPNPYAALPLPPLQEGVMACLSWANQVGLMSLAAVTHPAADLERIKLVQDVVAKLGMLKDKARHSWKACQVRELYQGQRVDLLAEQPPLSDALAAPAWAFLRLTRTLDEMCRTPFDQAAAQRWKLAAQLTARLGYVAARHEIDAVIDAAKAQLANASPGVR